jgi:hypothetical protein
MSADNAEETDWRYGVSLCRAAELLAPEAWATYRTKSIPIMIIGDPASEQDFIAGKDAEEAVKAALLDQIRNGRLELRVLHPAGNPEATWTRLSPCIVNSLSVEDLDLEGSTVCSQDEFRWAVRTFLASTPIPVLDGLAGRGTNIGERKPKKIPIKLRIAEAMKQLTPSESAQLQKRGGKLGWH